MTPRDMTANPWIAAETRGAAELLSVQGANLFRVAAYRRAASFISQLEGDLLEMGAAGGWGALDKIPGIVRGQEAECRTYYAERAAVENAGVEIPAPAAGDKAPGEVMY